MPKRIPLNSVHVVRDGKIVRPAIGQPFDFTAAELDDIKALMPEAVRTLTDEAVVSDESKAAGTQTLGASGTTRDQKADAKAGKVKDDDKL